MNIATLLKNASEALKSISDTPLLDAEILLSKELEVPRSFLHTWPEQVIEKSQSDRFAEVIKRRQAGEPLAYIVGKQEFWSLEFQVNHHVLIPRPETELIVELVLKSIPKEKALIADLGTGSGAIACSIAVEKKDWLIHATDLFPEALKVAEENARRLKLNHIHFLKGNWCEALLPAKYDAIVSNPPYISAEDTHLEKLKFEPRSALVSSNGVTDLELIIKQAKHFLMHQGYLFLEHSFDQSKSVATLLQKEGYTSIKVNQDHANLDRVTSARSSR